MTAPGASTPQPGRAAWAVSRTAVVLWALLLAGLLALLPCAGGARAAEPLPRSAAITSHATADHSVLRHKHSANVADRPGASLIWCAADGGRPVPGSCFGHPFCGPEAQLPNAPPQPAGATPLQPAAVRALPCGRVAGVLTGPDHAPDLHLLQVHRS